MSLECRLLQLLDFGELLRRHLLNQLLKSLKGNLTNLNELHGRRVVRFVSR